MRVLVLNPGSSTLKFGIYTVSESEITLLKSGTEELSLAQGKSFRDAAQEILTHLLADGEPDAIGARVVHGGEKFVEPTRVTPDVLSEIRALSPLAPLHNPLCADTLDICLTALPNTPVVALFDTAFHRTLPAVARTYAIPHDLAEQHALRRYGFHGIAHQNVSERLLVHLGTERENHGEHGGTRGKDNLTTVNTERHGEIQSEIENQKSKIQHPTPDTRTPADSSLIPHPSSLPTLPSSLITCHLGSGASACAIRNGESVDTSMGLTPMEGLVMGTRSGDIDPGLLLHLLREVGMTAEQVDDLLNKRSGLLGISGVSNDLRDIEKAAREGDERAELAMEVFAYRVAKTIGAYAVALEGLDALAFSGGIGEHSESMRSRICRRLAVLGVLLDPARNAETQAADIHRISADESRVAVYIVPADENAQMARETFRVVGSA